MAEQELLLKGPGTFPLERLLAIFQCITYGADISIDEEEEVHDDDDDTLENQGAQNDLTSNVLLQVSSLCNANFISKGSSCPLEGSTRYKSTVSEELAVKVNFLIWLVIYKIFFLTILYMKYVSYLLKPLTDSKEPEVSHFPILV